jgi:hypothetical protein
MAFALTYQDYTSSHPGDATGGSEGGQGSSSLMSEDAWNNLTDAQKWNEVGNGIVLTPADARYADLAKELGITNGRQIVGGPTDKSIPLDDKNFVDPSRVAKQGDNFFTSDENLTPKAQEQGGVADWFWPVAFIAGAVGGSALANAGVLSGTAVTGAEATAAGGITGGADIAGAAGATVGETAGTAGSMTGVAGDESAGLNMTPGAAGDESAGLNLGASGTTPAPDPTLPPGTQSPAPVTDATPSPGTQGPAPVTDASVPAQNGGVINNASNSVTRGINSFTPDWYNNLSPGARQILGLAISTGARAAISGVSQQHAIDAAHEAEDRHRADVVRQGQVPLLPPNTFVAKPGGIINNASNGGTGP